jgi:hypothetical protein
LQNLPHRHPLTNSQLSVAWYFGARFDLAFKSILSGNFSPGADVLASDKASRAAAAATSAINSARDEL